MNGTCFIITTLLSSLCTPYKLMRLDLNLFLLISISFYTNININTYNQNTWTSIVDHHVSSPTYMGCGSTLLLTLH